MTYYGLGLFIGAVVTLINGAWVLFSAPEKKENRLWALLSVCVANWSIGRLMIFRSATVQEAWFWERFMYVGTILVNVVHFHFTTAFLNKKPPKWMLPVGYLLA